MGSKGRMDRNFSLSISIPIPVNIKYQSNPVPGFSFPKSATRVPHCVELIPNLFVRVTSGLIPDLLNKVQITSDTDPAYDISTPLVRVDKWVDKASESTKEITVPISYRQS